MVNGVLYEHFGQTNVNVTSRSYHEALPLVFDIPFELLIEKVFLRVYEHQGNCILQTQICNPFDAVKLGSLNPPLPLKNGTDVDPDSCRNLLIKTTRPFTRKIRFYPALKRTPFGVSFC